MVKSRTSQSTPNQRKKSQQSSTATSESMSLGAFIQDCIGIQFNQVCHWEIAVLGDDVSSAAEPFYLAIQRLQVVVAHYGEAIALPKQGMKRWRNLVDLASEWHGLDRQIEQVKQNYQPLLDDEQQKRLSKNLKTMLGARACAFLELQEAIAHPRYKQLKEGYQAWLEQPQFTALGKLPLTVTLPSLVSSQLSQFLLHPGWWEVTQQMSDLEQDGLHEFYEVLVQFGHQVELLCPLYGGEFQAWKLELETAQKHLKQLLIDRRFHQSLMSHLSHPESLADLDEALQQQQMQALSEWIELHNTYLTGGKRDRLHHLVLKFQSPMAENISLMQTVVPQDTSDNLAHLHN
jgi:CHAD domain-containing protein